MKRAHVLFLSICFVVGLGTGCQRSSDEVWNDTKTAGRHVGRGVDTIGGKQGSSRQINDDSAFGDGSHASQKGDFVPLDDDSLNLQAGDPEAIPAPKDSPGDPGSAIPGIESFRDPAQDPELAPIFEHLHFEYNSSLIKGEENFKIVQKIADYMKNHPRLYVFIEGHCDKRGTAAYNLALGTNRSNAVRAALTQEGISPDKLFTISYGKERPLFEDEGEEFFRLNRRAQFKVYEK